MLADAGPFVLRTTLTSPFGRKVRMAAQVLGITDRITLLPADTLNEGDTLRAQNPLGKMPCLLLRDGSAIFDSRVIIEFLQEAAGSEALLAKEGLARYHALTRAALADGVLDAALLLVYEGRFREEGTHSRRWIMHQRGKVLRGLTAFDAALPDPQKTDIVAIGLSCALGYLDWRKPLEWRAPFPALASWLDAFAEQEPAYARTAQDAV